MKRVILLLVLVLSVGCTVADEEPFKISIATGSGGMTAPLNIALDQGYFDALNVQASNAIYKSGPESMRKNMDGTDDASTPGVVPIVLGDIDFERFAVIGCMSYTDKQLKILARKNAGISSPMDLRGKRIAVVKSTASHFYIYKYLTLKGISMDEVEVVFLSKKEMPIAINEDRIDAFCQHGKPFRVAKELLGDNAIVLNDGGLNRKIVPLIVRRDLIAKYPQGVQNLLRGLIQGEEFLLKHPREAAEIVAKAKDRNVEVLYKLITKDAEFHMSLRQSLLSVLEEIERWAINQKLVDRTTPLDYHPLIDAEPLTAVAPERVTLIQ